MPDSKAKKLWENENVIAVHIKINRNTEPELYKLLSETDNRSGLIRELLKIAINKKER